MPSGIMANLWGSSNWGYLNRLESSEVTPNLLSSPQQTPLGTSTPGSPAFGPVDATAKSSGSENQKSDNGLSAPIISPINTSTDPVATLSPPAPIHRKAVSVDTEALRLQNLTTTKPEFFPTNYPLALRTQEAQFRMLFPNVPREEKPVLVFRATWNPNEQQEFPGRVYVTPKDMYFYSHHLGLVLISCVSLGSIEEVTAAPGKDCDFIFLHLREEATKAGYTRITIKTFLDPLRLLQRRLNFLIDNFEASNLATSTGAGGPESRTLESIMAELIRLESEDPSRSPSMESWEDISVNTPIDDGTWGGRRKERDLRTSIHVERGLQFRRTGKDVTKFQLPSRPVAYDPPDMQRKAVEREFEISPKALFHVMFGDKSAVFQLLYHERRAQHIAQGPWTHLDQGHMRREFRFQIDYLDLLRRHRQANVVDYQAIDIMNDHVCYVVTDTKTPWYVLGFSGLGVITKMFQAPTASRGFHTCN
jgi:hypothetical protein